MTGRGRGGDPTRDATRAGGGPGWEGFTLPAPPTLSPIGRDPK